eukprot:538336-Pelagomonas_calceolata.AAC.2
MSCKGQLPSLRICMCMHGIYPLNSACIGAQKKRRRKEEEERNIEYTFLKQCARPTSNLHAVALHAHTCMSACLQTAPLGSG